MIVDAALSNLLISEVFPHDEHGSLHGLVKEACDLFHNITTGQKQMKDVELCDALSQIEIALETKKNHLQSSSRISKLWLEYQQMISVVRTLITADRISSGELHLYGLRFST